MDTWAIVTLVYLAIGAVVCGALVRWLGDIVGPELFIVPIFWPALVLGLFGVKLCDKYIKKGGE